MTKPNHIYPQGEKGKYDDECNAAHEATGATAVLLIVLGGSKGSGFSISIKSTAHEQVLMSVPLVLRDVAGQIEKLQHLAKGN